MPNSKPRHRLKNRLRNGKKKVFANSTETTWPRAVLRADSESEIRFSLGRVFRFVDFPFVQVFSYSNFDSRFVIGVKK